MAKPTTGVPMFLLALAVVSALPLTRIALASEDEPALAAPANAEAGTPALKGSLPAETAAAEQAPVSAPSAIPNDPVIPPVKRVIPVTPSLKGLAAPSKKPPAVKAAKTTDGGKPAEAKVETLKTK